MWAQATVEAADQNTRRSTVQEMTDKGFNIAVEAKKLEAFYESLLQ